MDEEPEIELNEPGPESETKLVRDPEPVIVSTSLESQREVDELSRPEAEVKQEQKIQLYEMDELDCEVGVYKPQSKIEKTDELGKGKFACSRCDYQTNRKDNLQVHINSVHDDIRYPCNVCEYKATQRSHLTRHKRNRHTNAI